MSTKDSIHKNKSKQILQSPMIVTAFAIFCCLLWGSAFPCIKLGYQLFAISSGDIASQILFAGIRFTFAGILTILAGSLIQKKFLVPKKESLSKILKLSMFQTVLQYLFFYIGLAHTTGVKGSIVNAVNVFFSILVSCLMFRLEKLDQKKLIGCIIGFIGGLVMAAAGLCFDGKISVVTVSGLLLLLYMAFISAGAYTIWSLLLKYNPVSKVAVFGFCTPIFGVILSAILLGEQTGIQLKTVAALVFVCAGIIVVNSKRRKFNRQY